uniref:Uncharacterized protein n=1 Tax=Calidris pygmaea TaxID=425635 RepID=A0A8C3JUI7_9CHAR
MAERHLKMSKVEKAFCKFVIFSDTSTSGNDMTGENFSKMYKECGVMDGKTMTSTDVNIIFNRVKGGAHTITFAWFQQAMKEFCSKCCKGKLPKETLQAAYGLIEGKKPNSVGATVSMSFLTHSNGSHKEHYDESGKGKCIAGCQDLADNRGYIGAYKGAGTYDSMH